MRFSRPRFLSSVCTTYHGADSVLVAANMSSRARAKSYHREYDLRSMSDNFHVLRGSSTRLCSRLVCSTSPTSSQYLRRMIPESTIACSTPGVIRRNRRDCSSVQKPITRSTPARLYQLRSNSTTSPAAGRWGMYRWMYICDFSRSVGLGRATMRNTRGLTFAVRALIVPPLPAESRPSNTTQTFAPVALTHSCIATSSACSRLSSDSYSLRFILATRVPFRLVARSPHGGARRG